MSKKNRKDQNPLGVLQANLEKYIYALFPLAKDTSNLISLIAPPPHIKADYCFSTFLLGKIVGQDPASIAKDIANTLSKIKDPLINRVFLVGPYVNIEVEKKLFIHDTLKCILEEKEQFGAMKTGKARKVCINYFLPELLSAYDELRLLLVGKVIGNCHELSGKQVQYNYYLFETDRNDKPSREATLEQIKQFHHDCNLTNIQYAIESEFIKKSKEVVKSALASKSAEYIAKTNAVATLDSFRIPSAVLQRYDGSTTNLAHHLAYIKGSYKSAVTDMVFLCSQEAENRVRSILANAEKIRLLSVKVNISIISVFISNENTLHIKLHDAEKYEILRTTLHENANFDKEQASYFHIKNFLEQLCQSHKVSSLDLRNAFPIIKLLLNFPKVVNHITSSHDPSVLALYLEELAKEGEKLRVNQDKHLSEAVKVVLQNGLRLLVF